MVKNPEIASMSLDGGTLCLNFINTVHNRTDDPLPDYLKNPLDVIAWGEKVGLLSEKTAKRLEKTIIENPKKGRHFFSSILTMRELFYRIFLAVAENKKISADDVAEFNLYLKDHLVHLVLLPQDSGFRQAWDLPDDSLQQITAPIVKDAELLLLSDKLDRVKQCPNCGWLFLDTTKNGKRRWCSMKSCGSNIKALDWYHRHKSSN